jgi:hypothetical protein
MAAEDIAKQLKATLEECARLREENKRLRSLLGIPEEKPNAPGAEGLSPEPPKTRLLSFAVSSVGEKTFILQDGKREPENPVILLPAPMNGSDLFASNQG